MEEQLVTSWMCSTGDVHQAKGSFAAAVAAVVAAQNEHGGPSVASVHYRETALGRREGGHYR